MIEPIFTQRNAAALTNVIERDAVSYQKARDSALLHRALSLALESAFRFGQDMPVGAVTANQTEITGRSFASDRRLDWQPMHAERYAVIDTLYNRHFSSAPDTLVVTIEPCDDCQDFIADPRWLGGAIRRVGFGISRAEVAERGLVRPHEETAAERVARIGYPYEVFQVEDEDLRKMGGIILDHVQRNTATGRVSIDAEGLNEEVIAFNVLG